MRDKQTPTSAQAAVGLKSLWDTPMGWPVGAGVLCQECSTLLGDSHKCDMGLSKAFPPESLGRPSNASAGLHSAWPADKRLAPANDGDDDDDVASPTIA